MKLLLAILLCGCTSAPQSAPDSPCSEYAYAMGYRRRAACHNKVSAYGTGHVMTFESGWLVCACPESP